MLVSRTYGDFQYTRAGIGCIGNDTVSSRLYQDAVYALVRRVCRDMHRSLQIDCQNSLGTDVGRECPILFFDTRIDTRLEQQSSLPLLDITLIGRVHWSYISRGCLVQDGFSDSMVIEDSSICTRNGHGASWLRIIRELLNIFEYHSEEVTSLHVRTLYRIIPLLRMGTRSL